MVDPAFAKMPAETVTIRMCLYSRVLSMSAAIFAKHFFAVGRAEVALLGEALDDGVDAEGHMSLRRRYPPFSSFVEDEFGDVPVCAPQKVISMAGIEIPASS